MVIIEDNQFNKLKADAGKILTYKEKQEEQYYFEEAYIPKELTLNECQNFFEEIDE